MTQLEVGVTVSINVTECQVTILTFFQCHQIKPKSVVKGGMAVYCNEIKVKTCLAVICDLSGCMMNLNLSHAMAPMQNDDMMTGKF